MSKYHSVIIAQFLFILPIILYVNNCSTGTRKKHISTNNITLQNKKEVISAPYIKVEKKKLNFGKIPINNTLTYHLKYKNTGTKPLILTKVRSNCNCTVVSYKIEPLLPGESDSIFLEMDTEHFGEFNKIVAIYSNAVNDYDSTINSSRVLVNLSWSVISKEKP